jgi:hypothetical protein
MRRTFRVRSITRQVAPLIVVSIITIGLLLVITEPEGRIGVWFVAAILVLAVALAAWLVTRTRLEIGPDGVTYHGIGFRVRSRWDNVAGSAKRVMGMHDIDSLILREPGIELSGWMELGYRLVPAASVVAAMNGRVIPASLSGYEDAIPVGMFDGDWRRGEIGSLIRSYAPRALDAAPDGTPSDGSTS